MSKEMALYVESRGSEDAPTILFLHGGGVSGWSWEPVVRRFPDYHCLVPDLPEHGRSRRIGPFSMRNAAEALAEVVRERAHGGRAHLVGISLGGQVGLKLLSRNPELVDRAVLSGVLVRPVVGGRLIPPMAVAYMPLRNIPYLVRANMRQYGVPEEYEEQFREETREATAGAMGRIFRENLSFRIPAGLGRVDRAVLLLVGQREPGVVRESARDLAQSLPRGEAMVVISVAHSWSLEMPGLFARAVRNWIEDLPTPPGLKPLE